MKKNIQELEEIRKKTLNQINLRKGRQGYKVVIGMATCGIAAGARPVMMKIMEQIDEKNLTDVTIVQTGCLGECSLEPIVEVFSPDGSRVTYGRVDEDKAARIVMEHLINGNIVEDLVVTMDVQ